MKPSYPNPPKSRLVHTINNKQYEIDYINHNIGIYYTLDISHVRYHYFQKRFFHQMKSELDIDLEKIFRKKQYFTDIYQNFNNIVNGNQNII